MPQTARGWSFLGCEGCGGAWPCSPTAHGWAAGSGCPEEAAPDPASALLPGSSMFRAPCMSQRRLALIFCVSVLIVLLIALILLCEWGHSPGAPGSWRGPQRRVWGYPHGKCQRETPGPGTGMCSSHSLSVPDLWWRDRGWGEEKRDLLPGLVAVFGRLGLQRAFLLLGLLW